MKRLIPLFLLFWILASCKMGELEYYDAGYFHSVPPRSEIYGFDERPHDYRHPDHYHGHKKVETQKNTHEHNNKKRRQKIPHSSAVKTHERTHGYVEEHK